MTQPYQPQWMTPDQDGELCNFHGSNTGADAINLKVRVLNPGAGSDLAGGIRVVASRTALKGTQQDPQVAWDSGWIGAVSTSPLPTGIKLAPNSTFVWNGRVYVAASNANTIYSAPLTGVSVGAWRAETTPVKGGDPRGLFYNAPTGYGSMTALTAPNGQAYVYAICQGIAPGAPLCQIIVAPINGDGTFGSWAAFVASDNGSNLGYPFTLGTVLISGYDGHSYAWLTTVGTGAADAFAMPVFNDGMGTSITGGPTTNLPSANVAYSAVYDSANGKLIILGGATLSGAPVTTVLYASVTAGTGQIGAYSTSGAPLPAARSYAAATLANGRVYLIGGASAASDATPTNTVYSATPAVIETTGAGSWTTDTRTLPASLSDVNSFALPVGSGGDYLAVAGGNQTAVYADAAGVSGLTAAWSNGPSSGLTAGMLGTGGSVTNNPVGAPQGSQDIGFAYAAFGTAPVIASFNDGDQIQFTVYCMDSVAGDQSLAATRTVKIGQPPAISAITPSGTVTNGDPPFSFTSTPGAGGAQQLSWDFQVTSGGNVVWDSTTKYDQTNSGTITAQPQLANGVYGISITVRSQDTAMAGSSASAISTSATFTVAQTPPGNPSAVTAVADSVNGLVTVTATSGTSATGNRIYKRDSGTLANLELLKDSVANATLAAGVKLMDEIALGKSYDYGVSSLSATGESAIQWVTGVTISPDYHFETGGFMAMLHVAGNGVAQHVNLFLIQQPVVTKKRDSYWEMMFGQTAPSARFGVSQFHLVEVQPSKSLTDLTALENVLDAANSGSVLCYRDLAGAVYYVTLDHETADHTKKIHLYADFDLYFVEIGFTYQP